MGLWESMLASLVVHHIWNYLDIHDLGLAFSHGRTVPGSQGPHPLSRHRLRLVGPSSRPGAAGRPDSGRSARPRGGSDQQGQHGRGDGDQAERLLPPACSSCGTSILTSKSPSSTRRPRARRKSASTASSTAARSCPASACRSRRCSRAARRAHAAMALPQESENSMTRLLAVVLAHRRDSRAFLAAQEKTLADRLSPAHQGPSRQGHGRGQAPRFRRALHLDADEPMPTASLIKFMVMLEVYQQVARRQGQAERHGGAAQGRHGPRFAAS